MAAAYTAAACRVGGGGPLGRNVRGIIEVHDYRGRRWDLSQNTTGGESAPPTDTSDQPAPDPSAAVPDPAVPHEPAEPPAGLQAQARRTVDAARRLVTTHVDLAKAELSEIAEGAKAAALLVAIAIALLLFVVILLPVGSALFLGEWLFGSIGWGVLHGTLFCLALVVVLLLGALQIPSRHLATRLAGAFVLGIVVAIVLGLAWPNQLFARVGESLIPGVEAGVRPLVTGLSLGALVVGVLALLAGARLGGAAGAVGGLVGGAVVGALIGAFLAISFSLHVGIALGICATLIAWPALAATALQSYDWGVIKARYWPGTTIATTKETIEWVRARTPLGRKP